MHINKNIRMGIWLVIGAMFFMVSCNTQNDNRAGQTDQTKAIYTCPMHPEIIRSQPGECPVCGMTLVKKEKQSGQIMDLELGTLLKPTDEYVLSSIPVISLNTANAPLELDALGTTAYDTRMIRTIAANVSGRIERIYFKYNFQDVRAGQKVMDIYSPELVTDQENLLFLLKNDPGNTGLIQAAREKLLLLGMGREQLQQVIKTGKPFLTVSVYSNYTGHIHDSEKNMEPGQMAADLVTRALNVKEGVYVQKGETVFSVYNPHHLWALVSIYADQQPYVKTGDRVSFTSETMPGETFHSVIDYIEPFFRNGTKTLTARVYFDNSQNRIPVGSRLNVKIYTRSLDAKWLPKDAVLSLGRDQVVFLKSGAGFQVHKVETGIPYQDKIQVTAGLSDTDSVAANAQFLADSESFIKTKD